jgi:lysophospholipase L1-like esterase
MNFTSITKGAVSHLWQSFHDTFNGFTNVDIFDHSLWKVEPKTLSTTIAVNPDIFDQLTYELCARYGSPEDKGRYGCIYRCVMPGELSQHVTVTCYASTSTLSVQGSQHQTWVDIVLSEIGDKFTTETDGAPFSPGPFTSTPTSGHVSCSADKDQDLPKFELNPDLFDSTAQTRISTKSQTDSPPDESPKLRAKIQSLTDKLKNVTSQLEDYNTLRNNYTQLSSAFSDLSERNSVLEAEIQSLKVHHAEPFQTKVTGGFRQPRPDEAPAMALSNSYSPLTDLLPESTIPTAPSISMMTPPKQISASPKYVSPSSKRPCTPSSSSPKLPSVKSTPLANNSTPQTSPQILIFSNSICKKISEHEFYKGRTTKLYAKSGATIADVQRLVEDCEYNNPSHVILQAWTNNITRESTEACESKARKLINAAKEKFPRANIIVSSVLPRLIPLNRSSSLNFAIRELNTLFEQNCHGSNRVFFANHIPSFVTQDRQIRHELYWDNVHLNNHGLGRLVLNLRNAIDSTSHPTWDTHQLKT